MRKKFIDRIPQNTRKPEGFWRRTLLRSINHDHAAWARWGLSHLDWHHTWNVLDIGCGGGANIARMMSLCPKGLIYGIDASEESVDSSRKYNRPELDKRCFILQGTVDCLPFDVDTFDVITAFEALYSWPDLEKAFKEAKSQTSDMRKALRSTEGKLKQVNEQIHYTGQYLANKSVYRQFVKSRNKKKFRQEHPAELTLYETARKFLKGQSEDGKLPSMKLLKEEKEKLAAQKDSQKEAYRQLRKYEKELNTVRSNIKSFLGKSQSRQMEEPQRDSTRS